MSDELLVVGSGIVGLACAWAGLQRGMRVRVLDRDPQCVGASVRNFGFVTVTGQGRGDTWRRARRSRDVWAQIASLAGIEVLHQGLYVLARRPQAQAVLRQLLEQPEGAQLQWLDRNALAVAVPTLAHDGIRGALYSPHELRIEPRMAIEQLRRWLASQGVIFHMGVAVQQVLSGHVLTTRGGWDADRIVVCPGPDLRALYPRVFAQHGTRLCQLQMLRVRPPAGYRLSAAVMSDLSLVRYRGYTQLPASQALAESLAHEQAEELAQGIHLIVVQSADGTLVVGDSHHYGEVLMPFASAQVEQLILQEMQRVLRLRHYEVIERWTGLYPSSDDQDAFIAEVAAGVDLLSVTSGTGMSTAFGLAEDWIQMWKGQA